MSSQRIVPYGYYRDKITVSIKENPVEWKRQWTIFNKERKKELDRKNKDHINAMRRKRRQTEAGAKLLAAEQKRYRKKNRTKLTQHYLNRRRTDFNFKILTLLRGRITKALKGYNKYSTTVELLGCSTDELWTHLESKFTEGMTKENHGEWHVDHIIPCSSFDLTDPEQQAKCFHYTNLQPLWALDNIKKGQKCDF